MSRAVLALVLYGVWIGIAFGVRTLLHWRQTGSSGFKGLSGALGSLEWFAGVAFVLSLAGGFIGTWMHGSFSHIDALETGPLLVIGVLLAVTGITATLVAQLGMGTSWRIGVDPSEKTELITDGLFRLARNPIFTAMGVTSAGLVLVVPNVVTLLCLVFLLVALQIQVRLVEEPYLRLQHGDAYLLYARTVGRFVPGVGRLHE